MMASLEHFFTSAVILLITILIFIWWNKNRNLPPGPWGLPFFGYYPFLKGKLYQNFIPLSQKYGPVFSFRTVGGQLVVVVSGPKLIKEVLVSRSEEFNGRPPQGNALHWISDGLGLIQEEGAPWKDHRRFFLQTVKNYGFGKVELEDVINEEIRPLLQEMKETGGEEKDYDVPLSYVVNSIISRVLFARKMPRDTFPELVEAFHRLLEIFSSYRFLLVGKFFRYVAIQFFPWSARIRSARKFAKRLYTDIINEHIIKFNPHHLKDYVDSYLVERTKDRKSFSKERLISISMNMTMEGTETVTAAILCLMQEAAKHPEEQKLVQQELDTVVGRERLPSWLDRKRLPYLEAFIQELHRKGQSFYTTAQYSNYEETTLEGYRIPKRTIFFFNLWTINNDIHNFPDPQKFDVHRFLPQDGKKVKREGPYPFGLGKRDCVGQSLAVMEVFLILSSVLQNFSVLPGTEPETLKFIQRDDFNH